MKFPDKVERNNKDVWYGVGVALSAIIVLPAILFVMAVIKAFVLATLWHWYIVKFFNQPELPLAISFGIALIVSYLSANKDVWRDTKLSDKLLYMIFLPVFTLILGWIGTFFI